MLLRTGLQVVLFLLLASSLGAAAYGNFAAVLALFAVVNPLVATGPGLVLSQSVLRRETSLADAAGAGIAAVAMAGCALLVLVSGTCLVAFPEISWVVLLSIGTAELICVPLAELFGRLFQATGLPVLLPGLAALVTGLRLAFFGGWMAWSLKTGDSLSVETWAVLYGAASAAAAALSTATLAFLRAVPRFGAIPVGWIVRQSAPLAVTGSATRVYADADKALMLRFADATTTGWYSVASRVVDVVTLPAMARLEVRLPGLMAEGTRGLRPVWRMARRELAWLTVITLVGGVLVWCVAGLLPTLLGPSFGGAVLVLQSLCLLPWVVGCRGLFRYVLLASDLSRLCAKLDVGAACLNVALNLLLIPPWGWAGGVVASYASALLIVALSAVLVARHNAGEPGTA